MDTDKQPIKKQTTKQDWGDYLFTKPVWLTISAICFILLQTTDWTGPGVEEKPPVLLIAFLSLVAPGLLYFIASSIIGILGSVGFLGYVVSKGIMNNKKTALVAFLLLFGPAIIATIVATSLAFALAGLFYIVLFFVFLWSDGGWDTVVAFIIVIIINIIIASVL